MARPAPPEEAGHDPCRTVPTRSAAESDAPGPVSGSARPSVGARVGGAAGGAATAGAAADPPSASEGAASPGSEAESETSEAPLDGKLTEEELAGLRSQLRERLEALRLARQPISPEERRAADAVLWTYERAQGRARKRDSLSRFPLHSISIAATRGGADLVGSGADTASAAWATRVLDAVFGSASGPDADARPSVPTEAGPDDSGDVPLPQTAAYLADLATQPSTAPLAPVGPAVDLPFAKPPDWTGARRWGGVLRAGDLSAEDARDLRGLLYKELRLGAVRVHASAAEVRLITPVHVVRSVTGKLRLVHDLRALNARLIPSSVKYETVRDAVILRGRVATKGDLAAAFKHIPVTDEAASCMAFQVDNVVFSWRRLPFGMSHSPQIFQAALQPVIEEARRLGLRVVSYVDDVYICADSAAQLDADLLRLLRLLAAHGWRVAPDKVIPIAHARVTFLGIGITPATGALTIPESKARKLEALCRDAIGTGGTGVRVAARKLEKVLGLLSFFMMAVPTVGLGWRCMHGALAEAQLAPGRHVWLRGGLARELEWWAANAAGLPNWPTVPGRGQLPADTVCLATDASTDGLGALWWSGLGETPALEQWQPAEGLKGYVARAWGLSEAEKQESSAVRELMALEAAMVDAFEPSRSSRPRTTANGDLSLGLSTMAAMSSGAGAAGGSGVGAGSVLQTLAMARAPCPDQPTAAPFSHLPRPSGPVRSKVVVVRWFSDSTAAVCALRKWRSVSAAVSTVLDRILQLVLTHSIALYPEWVSRELGFQPAADFLSRVVGRRAQAEWSVPRAEFEWACDVFRVRPTLDAFATRSNTRCLAYRSRGAEPGGRIDAFAAPWHRVSYAYPPFQLCRAAVAHWSEFGRCGDTLVLLSREPHVSEGRVRVLREMPMRRGARLLDCAGRPFHAPPPTGLRWVLLRLS